MKLNYTIKGKGSPVLLLHPVGSALTFGAFGWIFE